MQLTLGGGYGYGYGSRVFFNTLLETLIVRKSLPTLALAALCALSACSGDDDPAGTPAGAGATAAGGGAGGVPAGGGGSGGGQAGGPCDTLGERSCADTEHEQICEEVGAEATWVVTACPTHQYCITDRCEPACVDECTLGSTRTDSGSEQVCRLYSEGSQGFVDPGSGTHDKARQHDAWMRVHQLANGYVAEALHTDDSLTTIEAYMGTVDAAEWTGTYLAAQSLRLMKVRAPDAEHMAEQLVESAVQLFEVTGTPGTMARIWTPLGQNPVFDQLYIPSDWTHHETVYAGGPAFWHGATSRDMYAGITLGLGLAYDALSSPSHREQIRQTIVALALELMQPRPATPVRIRFHALGDWQEQDLTFDLENTILFPEEMIDGRIHIQVGTDQDPSNYGKSELRGALDFTTNYRDILGQTPIIGGVVPSIPKADSALMLANVLRLALRVTEGQATWETDRAAIEAYYLAHRAGWIDVAKAYGYLHAQNCWESYFGQTIAFHPTYSLLRIEPDPATQAAMQNEVLAARMYPPVVGHFNAYFDFIAAAVGPAGLVSSQDLQDTASELAQFPAVPKTRSAVDNSAYTENPSCPGQSIEPIGLATRAPTDFIFQHHPFRLTTFDPLDRLVFAGADYLVAYWLGRYHDFIADDGAGTCTRWTEP